jgi:hypothetical protein
MAGVDQAVWEERNRDANRWADLLYKSTVYNAYLNWTVRREGGPDVDSYNKYFPNDPNPQDLTPEEIAELQTLREKYKALDNGYNSLGYCLETAIADERRKLLKETPLLLLLVEQSYQYLLENGWAWPFKAKKLIEQGYIMSEIRVSFHKDKSAWWTGGTLFRLHASGLQTLLHRVIECDGNSITYEPAGYTNYGYMLIKPRSKRPTKESMETFRQRECKPLAVKQAA